MIYQPGVDMPEVVYNISRALFYVICCPVSRQSDRAMPLAICIFLPRSDCLSDNSAKIVYLANVC